MTRKIVTQCFADGCLKNAHARGYCGHHYYKYRKDETLPLVRPQYRISSICGVDGCTAEAMRYGVCRSHWRTFCKSKVDLSQLSEIDLIKVKWRFWSRINKGKDDECWEWMGVISNTGYGRLSIKDKYFSAHHLMWFFTYKVMPTLFLLHQCDNKRCVNPRHLKEGTHAENMRESSERQLHARGVDSPKSKFTESDILLIRKQKQQGQSYSQLATLWNVNRSTIQSIVQRWTWAHI